MDREGIYQFVREETAGHGGEATDVLSAAHSVPQILERQASFQGFHQAILLVNSRFDGHIVERLAEIGKGLSCPVEEICCEQASARAHLHPVETCWPTKFRPHFSRLARNQAREDRMEV